MRPLLTSAQAVKEYRAWLWFLLGFTLLYIATDFAFNAALLNISSGFNIDEDGFRRVEVAGRILSSIGCALLVFGLWGIRGRFTLKGALGRFALIMVTVAPTFYLASEAAIENYLIKPSTAEQRAVAHTLDLAKRLEMSGVSEYALYGSQMKEDPHHVKAMTHAATFPLAAVLHSGSSAHLSNGYIDRLYSGAVSRFIDLHSLHSSADAYQAYLDSQSELEDLYLKYIDASKEIDKKIAPISDADFNAHWEAIRKELRSSWSQLEPVMQDAWKAANSEVQHQTRGIMGFYNAAMSPRGQRTLAELDSQAFIDRQIIRRGLYGRKLYPGDGNRPDRVETGISDNPYADICGGTGRIGRSCRITERQVFQHLWQYGNFNAYATRRSSGWPVTVQSYADFLASERVGREVRQRIQQRFGLRLDSSFDKAFQGSPSVTRRYINDATHQSTLTEWHRKMASAIGVSASSLSDLKPMMAFSDFLRVAGIEEAVRKHTGGHYSPNLKIGMSKTQFMDVVMRDMAIEMESAIMERYSRTTRDYSATRSGIEDGLSAYRATVIPPVALILSLFFSLVAIVKLPLLISEIAYINRWTRKDLQKPSKAIMLAGIAIIVFLPFLTVSQSDFEDGFLVGMAFAHDVSPAMGVLYHWLYVAEPYFYQVGQFLLEVSGLNNLEIIHVTDYADEIDWRS